MGVSFGSSQEDAERARTVLNISLSWSEGRVHRATAFRK